MITSTAESGGLVTEAPVKEQTLTKLQHTTALDISRAAIDINYFILTEMQKKLKILVLVDLHFSTIHITVQS